MQPLPALMYHDSLHPVSFSIKEQVENGIIELYFVRTEYQLADMFTKALSKVSKGKPQQDDTAEILKKFNYIDVKSASTLVDLEKPLVKDGDVDDVDVHLYRYMIRFLMYLTAFRPDIMFAVCACVRFQVTLKTSHLLAVKRIFRYLKGKPTLGLWYSRDSPFELVAYTDSDYARATQDRKSTTRCYLLIKGFDAGSGPPIKVGDEAVHKELGDRMERAATTASSLEAEHDSGDVDAQTRFETTSKQSNDPPLSRGYTLGSGEDSMKLLELMELCTKLSKMLHKNRQSDLVIRLLNTVRHNIVLSVKVNAARPNLVLPVQVNVVEGDFINTSIKGFIRFFIRFQSFKHSLTINPNSISSLIIKSQHNVNPNFCYTHNMVAFLEKPDESDGFHEIIDFLNANQIHYALTINPIIYTSCIQQFWATAKANTINGERQLQALIDKKKVIITESSIRSDLYLEDAGGTDCLPTATIFEEMARIGAKSTTWNEFSSTMASLIICLATNQKFNLSKYIFDAMLGDMSHHKKIYVNPSHTKKIFANMRRERKDFSWKIAPLFNTMMVQSTQDEGVDLVIPTNSNQIPITTQPSFSRSQKKQSKRKKRKDTTVTQEEIQQDGSVPTPSNDPPLSEKAKDAQSKEIADLKKRVQKLESLGDHEDASKQGRSIEDIDKDADVSLVDDTQGRLDDADMFDINDLHGDEEIEESSKGTEDELKSDKSKKAESSEEKAKGSRKKMLGKKRAGKEQQQESSKRQRMEDVKETYEHEEVKEVNETELKKHLLLKEGIMVHYQLIRADGSSKRYTSMIRMLQGIDREDLETLWKLVKTKHGDTRPEDEHERVLWGDLKVMFEPNIKSDVWRSLQGYKVTIWKLYDSCGVHFVRNLKIQKMNIKFRGGLLGLKRLQGFLELLLLSTVSIMLLLLVEVNTAQRLLMFISDVGEKVYAVGLQLLKDLLLSRG
ncbi:hypothetical protein Tco_0991939 [Tanacetum coccineum]|uniref:Reverse transcriptase Ty1/copia-type domain-containing protein n=1 Tax=Tanacetum coccineum TaxID=301880 RepID=A0ABQ5F0X2_9ASTR